MDDIPGAIERPAACTIRLTDNGDSVVLEIPSRPLGLLWVVFAANMAAFTVYIVGGILYLFYDIPILSGLWAHPPHPGAHGYARWLLELAPGWAIGIAVLMFGFTLVWLPLMTRETIRFSREGVEAAKINPLKRQRFASDWLNVAEIALVRDRERLRQGKLVISLLSGAECQVGENAAEADREWLASVCQMMAQRFG